MKPKPETPSPIWGFCGSHFASGAFASGCGIHCRGATFFRSVPSAAATACSPTMKTTGRDSDARNRCGPAGPSRRCGRCPRSRASQKTHCFSSAAQPRVGAGWKFGGNPPPNHPANSRERGRKIPHEFLATPRPARKLLAVRGRPRSVHPPSAAQKYHEVFSHPAGRAGQISPPDCEKNQRARSVGAWSKLEVGPGVGSADAAGVHRRSHGPFTRIFGGFRKIVWPSAGRYVMVASLAKGREWSCSSG